MKFSRLNIYGDYGKVERDIILEFENEFNIKLPSLYIDLITEHNAPWSKENCFDYRDDPKGNEPKICIVIHDEYDEKTGKRLLFPVAENFEAFLNGLKSFDEMLEKYS